MSDLADNIDPTLPLERVADIADPIARTSSALEAAAHWKTQYETALRLLGRELRRRGKREATYTSFELDHVSPATIETDGRGNYLATVKQ